MFLKQHHVFMFGLSLSCISAASLAQETTVTTLHYSKSELTKPVKESDFIQTKDLSDIILSQLTQVMVTMTNRQSGNNVKTKEAIDSFRQPSRASAMKKLSTMAVSPETLHSRPKTDGLRLAIGHQYKKAIEVTIHKKIPVIEKIRSGIKYNLDLKNPSLVNKKRKDVPEIRYGLVETDIILPVSSPGLASLGSMPDHFYEFARPAQVVYTIDKLSNDRNRHSLPPLSLGDEEMPRRQSVWSRLPSPQVTVKIDSADKDAAMSDRLGTGSIPGLKFTVAQVDGLFSTQFVADSKTNIQKTLIHQVNVPLYGEMTLSKRYNYKMKELETSATNLLGKSSSPKLNIHYAHTEKKARGEWLVKRDASEFSLIAEPRQGWSLSKPSTLGKAGDRVSINYRQIF